MAECEENIRSGFVSKYSTDSKDIILNILKVCQKEKKQGCLTVPISAPLRRTVLMTGVSESTVSRICRGDVQKVMDRKIRHDVMDIDIFSQGNLRRTIAEMITIKKVLPTLPTLMTFLQQRIDFKGSREHLRKVLLDIGFRWKKVDNNRKVLMERQDIITTRAAYLRKIKKLREAGRHLVFMDETFIHAGVGAKKCWQSKDVQHHVPYNKGERIIIVHAGSNHGFIPDAGLIFRSQCKSGDYHDDMNFSNYKRWMEEKLIPNLTPNSVLILDNAPYHNKQYDKCPTTATRKEDIQSWLQRNNIQYGEGFLKAELLELCKMNKPDPKFIINDMLSTHGHECVRLPPYHPDLNPIELVWAKLKRKVSEKNFTFRIGDVMKHTTEALQSITPDYWMACCQHVVEIERKYMEQDITVEAEIEKLEIWVGSSDEDDTDTASEGDNSETDTADETDMN